VNLPTSQVPRSIKWRTLSSQRCVHRPHTAAR